MTKSYFVKEFMGATHYSFLVEHSLKKGVKYPQNIYQICKHMKRFKEESGMNIKEFLDMEFTKLHVSPIASTIILEKERNGMH